MSIWKTFIAYLSFWQIIQVWHLMLNTINGFVWRKGLFHGELDRINDNLSSREQNLKIANFKHWKLANILEFCKSIRCENAKSFLSKFGLIKGEIFHLFLAKLVQNLCILSFCILILIHVVNHVAEAALWWRHHSGWCAKLAARPPRESTTLVQNYPN